MATSKSLLFMTFEPKTCGCDIAIDVSQKPFVVSIIYCKTHEGSAALLEAAGQCLNCSEGANSKPCLTCMSLLKEAVANSKPR